jgi:serine protease AprX
MNTLNAKPNFAKRPHRLLTLSALAAVMCGGATGALADRVSEKSDRFVVQQAARHDKGGWSHVIVRFSGNLGPDQERQLKGIGADVYRRLDFIHSAAMRVPVRSLERLAAMTFVAHISADLDVKKSDEFTVGHTGADVAFSKYNLTGNGIGVAVIDSGIQVYHGDLRFPSPNSSTSRVVANVSFVPNACKPIDDCGHGTHVAGIIAGSGASSSGSGYYRTFYGIARNANLVNVRVLDGNGQGSVSTVLAGIQWAIANKSAYNIRIMNLSLGHPVGERYTTDPLCQAVEQAWNAGITVVCAAGNAGRQNATQLPGASNEGWGTAYGSVQSPGNDPCVITVGAMKAVDGSRSNDKIATYSGRGPSRLDLILKPDIVAPGNRIISLDCNNSFLDTAFGGTNQIPFAAYSLSPSAKMSGTYFRLSGTSMAAPVAAGAAALMLEKDPTLTPDTIKARLMMSADKVSDASGNYDPCTFGAGYLNIAAALQSTAVATQPALSPALIRDGAGNVMVDTSQIIWGTASGTQVIWGVNGVADLRVIWGSQVIWGTTLNQLSASQVIWGTSVWNDQVIWGTTVNGVDLTSTAILGE